jgi:RNase P/RNase MRP subunit p29
VNIIGVEVTVVKANDPTKTGRMGEVVLETANTVLLSTGKSSLTVEKKGTTLLLSKSKATVSGEDIDGRLEDRLRSRKK